MKILIEGGDLNPPFNEGTRNIARTHWEKLVERGHKIVILTRARETITQRTLPSYEKIRGVTYYRWNNYLGLALCLIKIKKKENIEIIHIFAKSLRPRYYLALLKKIISAPILFSLLGYPFDIKYTHVDLKNFLKRIDYLAVSSKAVYDDLKKESIDDKINYLTYGVDIDKLKPTNKKKEIVCLKNPSQSLLRALKRIQEEFSGWKIIFDKHLTETTPGVKERILAEKIVGIEFMRRVPEISTILKETEILVESHPFGKFLDCASPPLLIIESMACGAKIVSANIPEITEVISDGKEGFVYNSENEEEIYGALKKGILSGKNVQRMARLKVIEKYNANKQESLFEKEYRKLQKTQTR